MAIYDLAWALDDLGHRVDFYAPPLSWRPTHGRLFYMRSSYGTSTPWFWECEKEMYDRYGKEILGADVVHDFSHTKRVAEVLYARDRRTNVVSTLIGSVWNHPEPSLNVIVWTEAMRVMGLKGWTGYEGSPWAAMFEDKKTGSLKDAHVVPGGVDTDFYAFEGQKEDYFLWFARFHPSKGYQIAIELARRTGIPLVLAGLHPDDAVSPDHREGAIEAMSLAKGVPNIRFEWLPKKDHHVHKRRMLQKAKALLYTIQFQECFGLVVTEALSCGTPVIASMFGSMPEIVHHGQTGLICGTWDALMDSVKGIEKIRPEDCAREARARFDRHVMAKAYVEQYRKVMNGEVWGL